MQWLKLIRNSKDSLQKDSEIKEVSCWSKMDQNAYYYCWHWLSSFYLRNVIKLVVTNYTFFLTLGSRIVIKPKFYIILSH